jgi:ribosomal protein S18 acetylase RimI-like enzyme
MRIRPARATDRGFVMDLAPRLTECGVVPARDLGLMIARDQQVLADAIERPTANASVFVAEDESGERLGFIHLNTIDDYYSGAAAAHVADLVVSPTAAGRGVGSALMDFAETWARERGFPLLTLHVFNANQRARELYAKLGFHEEWVRCIKRL